MMVDLKLEIIELMKANNYAETIGNMKQIIDFLNLLI